MNLLSNKLFPLIGKYFVMLIVWGVAVVFSTVAYHRFSLYRGYEELIVQCTRCHTLDRVLCMVKTGRAWDRTVSRMMNKGYLGFSIRNPGRIVSYLSEVQAATGERLFEHRCSHCHSLKVASSFESLESLCIHTERAIRMNPLLLGTDEREEIVEYLHWRKPLYRDIPSCIRCHLLGGVAARVGQEDLYTWGLRSEKGEICRDVPMGDYGLYMKLCGSCHTKETIFARRPKAMWEEIIVRMQKKAPHLVSGDNLQKAREFISEQLIE